MDSKSAQRDALNQSVNNKGIKAIEDLKLWKHILLKVKQRKRLDNGQMGNICQAVNIVTGEKQVILVDPRLIDEQDMAGLEKVLKT